MSRESPCRRALDDGVAFVVPVRRRPLTRNNAGFRSQNWSVVGAQWGMLAVALALSLQPSVVEEIDRLAQQRDVAGIAAYCSPEFSDARERLRFLNRAGVYGVGTKGWRAELLNTPDGTQTYVVFTTPLTSQDIGEQVFTLSSGKLTGYLDETEALGHRIRDHQLRLRFEPAEKKALIENTVLVERSADAATWGLMRLSPCYKVQSMRDADSGARVSFAQAGGVVAFRGTGTKQRIHLDYIGLVDLPEYAGSIGAEEAMLTNDYWYPLIARQPATYSLAAETSRFWTSVGQGRVVSDRVDGSRRTMEFRMDLPIVYFSFAAGAYKKKESVIHRRTYAVWSRSMEDADMDLQTKLYDGVWDFYSRSFGAPPFNGYGALVTPIYGGGALEAYSYATYGTGWLPDIDGHEPAHTWWGGMINNSYLTSLWNESFAEYSEGLFNREGEVGNREARRLAFRVDPEARSSFRVAPMNRAGASIGDAASSIGYEKGGYVLQMLEDQIGRERLVGAMRRWIETHPKGENGNWEDFERVLGPEVKEFFDQWVRRPGYASFEVRDVGWQNGKLFGTVRHEGEPYRISVQAMLDYPSGKREFVSFDTMQIKDGEDYRFEVAVSQKPSLVSIDPWWKVLRTYRNDERPMRFNDFMMRARVYVDPKRTEWTPKGRRARNAISELPEDLDRVLLVGSPETLPAMKALCEKAGFTVSGDTLTYKGRRIDLRQGTAMAVIDLGEGKRCGILLGRSRLDPEVGRAAVAVCDDWGRFLDGVTLPKTSGWMTFRL